MKQRVVDMKSPFGGSPLRDILALVLLPWTVFGFVVFATYEAVSEMLAFYFYGRPNRLPLRKGLEGKQEMDVFDPDDLDMEGWKRIRADYIDHSIPFVLKRKNGGDISEVAPPAELMKTAFTKGNIRVSFFPYMGSLPGLDNLVRKMFPSFLEPRAYWPLWFLGDYSQGKAHLDLGMSTYNCYFLRAGGKDVDIVPPEVSRSVALTKGLDGLFIPGTEAEDRDYLKTLPYYYHVDLTGQSMLIFNNANSIHHFRNVNGPNGELPEALSIRMKYHRHADPRTWVHLVSDVKMWWRFTTVGINQLLRELSEDRQATYL